MEIVSMVFLFAGIILSVNLIILFISTLKKRRIPYEFIDAKIKGVTTWIENNPKLETNIKWYRVEFVYSYDGHNYSANKNYAWEDERSGDFLKVYINSQDPNEVLTVSQYKGIKSVSNIIGLIIFNLLFIIPYFCICVLFISIKRAHTSKEGNGYVYWHRY